MSKDRYNSFINKCNIGGGEGRLEDLKIGIKDNISTKGIETTCGSEILKGYIPPFDATAVKRIKEEGGKIVGKTNMDEFGMGNTTETSAYGPTKNPIDEDYVPGGSSGGSAAAVASKQVDIALGTDTGGSVRCPSAFCEIIGLKPTYGLVSRYGLIAYANSLETIGPMARSIEDIALMLDVISGKDKKDATCNKESENYLKSIKNHQIKNLDVGIPKELLDREDMNIETEVEEVFKDSLDDMEKKEVSSKNISMPSLKYSLSSYYVIATGEASSNLARYDGIRYGKNEGSIKQTRSNFGEEVKRRIMLGTYGLSEGYYGKYYQKAQNARKLVKQDFEKALNKVDIIATPTMPVTPFKIGESMSPIQNYLADINTVPVNLAGVPSISIPCGRVNGLPVGIQLISGKFEETKLLKTAKLFRKTLT